jgi:aconitate hydratase
MWITTCCKPILKNADDHLFYFRLHKIWSLVRPGNGVSHPVHMERFGKPGKTLVGSDSHSCAAGSLGMLAIGTGGLDVAAMQVNLFCQNAKVLGVNSVVNCQIGLVRKM